MNHDYPQGRCCADAGGCGTCPLNPTNIERTAMPADHARTCGGATYAPGDLVWVKGEVHPHIIRQIANDLPPGDDYCVYFHGHTCGRVPLSWLRPYHGQPNPWVTSEPPKPPKPAPARAGEWRDYPDGPGTWVRYEHKAGRGVEILHFTPDDYSSVLAKALFILPPSWLRLPDEPPEK